MEVRRYVDVRRNEIISLHLAHAHHTRHAWAHAQRAQQSTLNSSWQQLYRENVYG